MRWCSDELGLIAVVVAIVATGGCVGEREFPKPKQMCENLVQACGLPILLEHESVIFRDCYAVGRAGVRDRKNEDQCFAFYDECINECEFFGYYLTLDSGADAEAGSDAEALFDAANDGPDATSRDE